MELAKRNAVGLRLILVSLLLGVAGDLILGTEAWGLSLPLYTAFLVVQVLAVARASKRKISKTSIALLVTAFAFSLCFLWRDAPELKLINGFAVFILVGLAALHATGNRLTTAPIVEFALTALSLWAVFVADFFLLFFKDVKWAEALRTRGLAGTTAVGRGLLIAVPLLVVFGGLLVSADASFQRFLQQFTDFDGGVVFTHVMIMLACAVLTGGLLRHIFLPSDPSPPKVPPFVPFVLAPIYHQRYRSTEPFRLGATEFAIVLGSLNLLFGLFVLIEAPYLFGGTQHVLATEHLSYADYARRGFFELVAVVALAIPVLLASHALIDRKAVGVDRLWRSMAVVMVSLLFVVMHSAIQRMRLYVDLYSLTTLRVYVLASLAWMAVMLLWFLVTTVRGRSERFAFGAFAGLLAIILGVNTLDPDALIVRYNVADAKPGKRIDGGYLQELSADGAPELIRNEAKLDHATRTALATGWLADEKASRGQWRSWTVSREAANKAIDEHRKQLLAEARPVVSAVVK